MHLLNLSGILIEKTILPSSYLERDVIIDFYLPKNVTDPTQMTLLLINDGQNMKELGLASILEEHYGANPSSPLLCAAIYAGEERKMEYGTAHKADYKGRGAKAKAYTCFIIRELIPFIQEYYFVDNFKEKAFAGFSLGGLSAIDITWNHPEIFSKVGVFSGSLWWRTKSLEDETYSDYADRIMHTQIRKGPLKPGLKFFFQAGAGDEHMDRNNNGIIDSIDDTLDLMKELKNIGYTDQDITYHELEDGKHDVATWAKMMPVFLEWIVE